MVERLNNVLSASRVHSDIIDKLEKDIFSFVNTSKEFSKLLCKDTTNLMPYVSFTCAKFDISPLRYFA